MALSAQRSTATPEEMHLVAAIRDGDERAFTTTVERHYGGMLALAKAFVLAPETAAQAVHDAWTAALGELERFDGRTALRPWLLRFVVRLAAPLAAGNTVVLKPAELTPLTALMLGRVALEAGLPPGVLNIVPGPGPEVGGALARHEDVALISVTGSTRTGASVMREAAGTVKRVHMELGGKAPFVVFEDANLEAAAEGAMPHSPCRRFGSVTRAASSPCRAKWLPDSPAP